MSENEIQPTIAFDGHAAPAGGPSSVPPRLVVVVGVDTGRKLVLDRDEVSVGRDPQNDLVLGSSVVSARHARVRRQDDGFAIEDCDSTNGVRVNGEQLPVGKRRVLRHGDAISISDHMLLFLSRISSADMVDFSTIQIDRDRASREAEELLKEFPGIAKHLRSRAAGGKPSRPDTQSD
jgi:pSer/pThr/pTyr-binding forkhead associated (FHA) protein